MTTTDSYPSTRTVLYTTHWWNDGIAEYCGDFADDYDLDGVEAELLDQINDRFAADGHPVTLHRNGELTGPPNYYGTWADPADHLAEIMGSINLDRILMRHIKPGRA